MNRHESDILNILLLEPFTNQRSLAKITGHSLGIVNRSLKNLLKAGYIDEKMHPTPLAMDEALSKGPRNAIILAAGFGMRMVPINTEVPKGLLEIHGEPLIERTIKQLHEVGITDISMVVGFMKERYEYLIDEYGVELIVNPEYAKKNNLHSLKLVCDRLSNTYVIPCDIWCSDNPYRRYELYSWYMVSDKADHESEVKVNRMMELTSVPSHADGNAMIGICYLLEEDASIVREHIKKLCENVHFDDSFWEAALYQNNKIIVAARMVQHEKVIEINTYEQLREFDSDSNHLKTDAIKTICEALHAIPNEITDIEILKKGMTNRSFLFICKGKKYIMRIPGEGTSRLINRRQEADVYHILEGKHICDDVAYINPQNGYKISEFWENARVCDPFNEEDIKKCMHLLREFHELRLSAGHTFDIFGQINFYESLWDKASSSYKDYAKTKENIFSLKAYIDAHASEKTLAHIDAVPDNFLFVENGTAEELRLIDWEYAGVQDPHIDIAMFCIYSLYDRSQTDHLIDIYFPEGCNAKIRIKIYCYIAVCGLLWSNWCEYKRTLGVEFGEYSLRQYRYAKDYFKIVQNEIKKLEIELQ